MWSNSNSSEYAWVWLELAVLSFNKLAGSCCLKVCNLSGWLTEWLSRFLVWCCASWCRTNLISFLVLLAFLHRRSTGVSLWNCFACIKHLVIHMDVMHSSTDHHSVNRRVDNCLLQKTTQSLDISRGVRGETDTFDFSCWDSVQLNESKTEASCSTLAAYSICHDCSDKRYYLPFVGQRFLWLLGHICNSKGFLLGWFL